MKEVSILCEFSRKMIQEKNYTKAKQAILKALSYSPNSLDLYVLLGNIYYLCRKRELSFRAYLSAMHIQINKLKSFHTKTLNTMVDLEYDSLSEAKKNIVPNRYAILIYKENNIPKHISHAFIDLNESIILEPLIQECAELYKESLIEGKDIKDLVDNYNLSYDDFNSFENSHYIMLGRELLLKNIKWKSIDSIDVRSIYF